MTEILLVVNSYICARWAAHICMIFFKWLRSYYISYNKTAFLPFSTDLLTDLLSVFVTFCPILLVKGRQKGMWDPSLVICISRGCWINYKNQAKHFLRNSLWYSRRGIVAWKEVCGRREVRCSLCSIFLGVVPRLGVISIRLKPKSCLHQRRNPRSSPTRKSPLSISYYVGRGLHSSPAVRIN